MNATSRLQYQEPDSPEKSAHKGCTPKPREGGSCAGSKSTATFAETGLGSPMAGGRLEGPRRREHQSRFLRGGAGEGPQRALQAVGGSPRCGAATPEPGRARPGWTKPGIQDPPRVHLTWTSVGFGSGKRKQADENNRNQFYLPPDWQWLYNPSRTARDALSSGLGFRSLRTKGAGLRRVYGGAGLVSLLEAALQGMMEAEVAFLVL